MITDTFTVDFIPELWLLLIIANNIDINDNFTFYIK